MRRAWSADDGVVAHWWLTRFLGRSGPTPHSYINKKDLGKIVAVMNQMVVFFPLLIVLGAFMFFASRRQKRAMQATIDLHESLRVGDRVHTTSGLQGTITGITDDTVDLEIAHGVVTTWMKLAVRDRIEPEITEDAEAAEVPVADDLADDPERLPKD
jgi:preprotein translocase subunit YajC